MRRGNNQSPESGEFEAKPDSRDSRRGQSFWVESEGTHGIFVGQKPTGEEVYSFRPAPFQTMCDLFDKANKDN